MSDEVGHGRFDAILPWPLGLTSRELTEAEAVRAADHINSRTTAAYDACQVCGGDRVVIQPALFPIPLPQVIHGVSGLYGYAHVMTICYNCGFTRLFNASVLGLTPDPNLTPNIADKEAKVG